MLPSQFIEKYQIKLNEKELALCKEAVNFMVNSKDVNHNETHAYRLLDYLDEFIQTEEFQAISKEINQTVLFMAILWHDTWKTDKDPSHMLTFFIDVFWDGLGSARKFNREAKKVGEDSNVIKEVRYIIKKHSLFQILPLKTLEAKILHDLDGLDTFSLDRMYLIEKKYLCERPVTITNLHIAKLAVRIFVEAKTDKQFFFQWAKKGFLERKRVFLEKAIPELEEYERLVNLRRQHQIEQFEDYLLFMKEKYLNRPEKEEKPANPF